MNLANKSFRDNRTGEVVRVIDSFENIAILENKSKIDTRRLLDQNYYSEYIDPNQFINSTTTSAHNSIFETIKSIPTDRIPMNDDVTNVVSNTYDRDFRPVDDSSAIVTSSVDEERAELARKYGVMDNTQSLTKQNEAFTKILGEDSLDELPPVPNKTIDVKEEVQRVEINRDVAGDVTGSVFVNNKQSVSYEKQYSLPVEDPVHTMFKGIKRSIEFSLDLNLENKIPKLEFIEMMEDSYEKSIIDFLAADITNSILNNPDYLREKIKEKIVDMVYNKKPVTKKATVNKTVTKRQPKPNTALGEKPGYKKPTTKKVTNSKLKEDLNTITTSKKDPVKKETEQI
jgi:hypothetical protein